MIQYAILYKKLYCLLKWIKKKIQKLKMLLFYKSIDMPMWKFWMIDILIVGGVSGITLLSGARWFCMRCFRKNTVKAAQE